MQQRDLIFPDRIDLFQVDNALSLIKLGALDGLGNNCIENASMHDLIYLSKLNSMIFRIRFAIFQYKFYFPPNNCVDDNQINAKSDFNGTNMSKIEPIDEDQDYHDADITSEAANYKDDDGSIENGNIDDTDKEAIDSKPILGSLTNISANVDGDKANAHVNVDEQRRNSADNGNTSANDTNLNETEADDRDDIDSKLGNFISTPFLL